MESIGVAMARSEVAYSVEQALSIADELWSITEMSSRSSVPAACRLPWSDRSW